MWGVKSIVSPYLVQAFVAVFLIACVSGIGNYWQWQHAGTLRDGNKALKAQLKSESAACGVINNSAMDALGVLETELAGCRGEAQETAERAALALRQRDRARREVERSTDARITLINEIEKRDENCTARAVCRGLSDELLRPQ